VKAAVFQGPGRLAVEEIPNPELAPDGLILKVEASGICGSDLRALQHGLRFAREWQILGHEVAGIVVEVGGAVQGYAVGDRLAIAADVHCGHCHYCHRALYNLCEGWKLIGAHYAGGMAEFMALPADILQRGIVHHIPEGLSSVHASLAEPAASVLASQHEVSVEPGEVVVIFGGGPVGCLHVQVARARGAKAILADVVPERLALAGSVGAWKLVNPSQADIGAEVRALTGGRGADVAIVACNAKRAQADAVQVVRKRGRVVLFGGLPKDDPLVQLDCNRIHYLELRVYGAFSYHPSYHQVALELIARGQIEGDKIITATYPLERIGAALEAARNASELKIVIVPS